MGRFRILLMGGRGTETKGRSRISVHGVGDSKGQNKDFCVRGLFRMKKIHFNRGRFTSYGGGGGGGVLKLRADPGFQCMVWGIARGRTRISV